MNSINQLFEHRLKDLYSAETQSLASLPDMADSANDKALEQVFRAHFEETKEHKCRIEGICRELNLSPSGDSCKAMEVLLKETQTLIFSFGNPYFMDTGLIAQAQRMVHYEISAYRTAARFAKQLGHVKVATVLQKSLNEEYAFERRLNTLAENSVNDMAMA